MNNEYNVESMYGILKEVFDNEYSKNRDKDLIKLLTRTYLAVGENDSLRLQEVLDPKQLSLVKYLERFSREDRRKAAEILLLNVSKLNNSEVMPSTPGSIGLISSLVFRAFSGAFPEFKNPTFIYDPLLNSANLLFSLANQYEDKFNLYGTNIYENQSAYDKALSTLLDYNVEVKRLDDVEFKTIPENENQFNLSISDYSVMNGEEKIEYGTKDLPSYINMLDNILPGNTLLSVVIDNETYLDFYKNKNDYENIHVVSYVTLDELTQESETTKGILFIFLSREDNIEIPESLVIQAPTVSDLEKSNKFYEETNNWMSKNIKFKN